jgi:hypothetical protein
LLIALALTAALTAGCGGSDKPATVEKPVNPPAPTNTLPAPAPPKAPAHVVAVVKAWANALRQGKVRKASTFFALPAVVENASAPAILRTRADVRLFNTALPCGARFVRALQGKQYTIVTFRLTERVGSLAKCGSGGGQLAATAFAFRRGKISEWRRVTVPPAKFQPPGQSV